MAKLKEGQVLKVQMALFIDPRDKETIKQIAEDEQSNESVVARRMIHAACEAYRKNKASGD